MSEIGAQHGHLELDDFLRAMQLLPDEQREALVLIGASGFSYEEAAEICEVMVVNLSGRGDKDIPQVAEILAAR